MRHYRLFQAWQNQEKKYTNFITNIIQQVVEIERKKDIEIEVIRFPAQDEAGSPDVVNMVWEQIASCDLFVGDLTAIAKNEDQCISNPNVMYEVGIADALLGEKRVILVCSKETNIAKLAFDVNHKRISPLNIKDEKALEKICEWIEAGIAECDIQHLQRDFVLQNLYDDFYVVYNNFMRIVFYNDFVYSMGTKVPSIETIKIKLENAILNELMISVDYSCIIARLQDKIRTLYERNSRRYILEIICIYKALDKFNWFIHSIQKSKAFIERKLKSEIMLGNTKEICLTDVAGVDKLYGSILFGEKYIYVNGNPPLQNVYLREMFTDRIKEICHYQNATVGNMTFTAMKMSTYSLIPEVVDKFAECVYEVLTSVFDFMEKMNFIPVNKDTEIRSDTIIIWKKEDTGKFRETGE